MTERESQDGGGPQPHPSDVLQNRLIDFAVEVMKVAGCLPRTHAGRHIAQQMLRSGTSPAPNYGEARAAESTDDFVHKLKVVLKELNETLVWLFTIIRSRTCPNIDLTNMTDECDQLCRIIAASIRTARERRRPK